MFISELRQNFGNTCTSFVTEKVSLVIMLMVLWINYASAVKIISKGTIFFGKVQRSTDSDPITGQPPMQER